MTTPTTLAAPRRPRWRRRAATALALLLIALIPLAPALLAGRMPDGHEAGRYEILTLLFRESLARGTLYPRWLPDLAGGYGYPTFLFYQPLFFYVTSACSLVPRLPLAAWPYAASFCFAIVGASGAYALARPIVRSRGVALACAAMFVLTPYLFVNLYVRGDHSEAAAMMLGPWPLALLRVAERRCRAGRRALAPALFAAIALAAILAAHPAFALIYVPIVAAIALARALAFHGIRDRGRWIAAIGGVVALAAAIDSPHWTSVFQHAPYVHLDRALARQYRPEVNLFPLSQLFSSRWEYDVNPDPSAPPNVPVPAQLGLPLTLLAVAGAWLGRRRSWVVGAALAAVLLVAAITPAAEPFWAWPHNPLRRIQFPWRLLAILATLQLLLMSHAMARLPRGRAAPIAWAIVVATVAWSHAMFRLVPVPPQRAASEAIQTPHQRALSWTEASDFFRRTRDELTSNGYAFAAAREFDPIWSHETPAPRDTLPLVATRAAARELPGHAPHRIDVELTSPAGDAAVIRQYYFPGWHAEVNGVAVPDDRLRDNVTNEGLMIVAIPPGTSRLIAYYDGPQWWLPRSIVAVGAIVGCVLLLRRLDGPLSSVSGGEG